MPRISRNELSATNFQFLNVDHKPNSNDNAHFVFLTKEEFGSKEALEAWWNKLCSHLRDIQSSQQSPHSNQVIETIAREMITTMCIIYSYLPKITANIDEKIATLLLNQNQVDIILNKSPWKLISGKFGSGKSIYYYYYYYYYYY